MIVTLYYKKKHLLKFLPWRSTDSDRESEYEFFERHETVTIVIETVEYVLTEVVSETGWVDGRVDVVELSFV